MSLLSAIQMAGHTLRANEIGLQVVGQNIANANTPGYIREDLELSPAPTQRVGGLLLGMGVNVDAVVQQLDRFLQDRLRGSVSDQASANATQQTYDQLESMIGELSNTDLSSSMTTFFNSISEILNQPEDRSVRNLAVLQGQTLTENIDRLALRVADLRTDANNRIESMAADINRLVEEIRTLNVRIAETEGGSTSKSQAVGLRDQREQALENLATLIDIRVEENPGGTVSVYTGGEFLVFEGISHSVEVVQDTDRGIAVSNIHMSITDAPLDPASGQLRGLLDSRDKVLGGFLDKLDTFAATLAFEFNKVYSQGQGLSGYSELTSESTVDDKQLALNAAGLKFTPQNGSFQVLVHNKTTGLTTTTDIMVHLDGQGHQTTLEDLAADIDAIPGISAEPTVGGGLTISSESPELEFSFARDTSGVLAALGVNTFFTGSTARDLGLNAAVQQDPAKFAASRDGIGHDTQIAQELANFIDKPIVSQGGASLGVLYNRITSETAQASSIAKAVAQGAQTFESTLRGQQLAISGVNLDEEAVKMIAYQRSYQAAAKFISALTDLFDLLVKI